MRTVLFFIVQHTCKYIYIIEVILNVLHEVWKDFAIFFEAMFHKPVNPV